MKRTVFLMLCASLCISFMATSCDKKDEKPAKTEQEGCVGGDPAPDYDFTVFRDEVFSIELISAPGAGMRWEWKNKADVTCVDTIGLEEVPLIEERRGDEVIEKWNFKGLEMGNCTLLFEYINARDKSVIERKEFLIRVKE